MLLLNKVIKTTCWLSLFFFCSVVLDAIPESINQLLYDDEVLPNMACPSTLIRSYSYMNTGSILQLHKYRKPFTNCTYPFCELTYSMQRLSGRRPVIWNLQCSYKFNKPISQEAKLISLAKDVGSLEVSTLNWQPTCNCLYMHILVDSKRQKLLYKISMRIDKEPTHHTSQWSG